jgi:ketopantoate reductase
MIDSHEEEPGHIVHEFPDELKIGPFNNPALPIEAQEAAARDFINIYGKTGKTDVTWCEDVKWTRWRKLVFNATLNPICAITGLDDARIRLANGVADGLVRPAMREVMEIAGKLGYVLPADIGEVMINADPMDLYLKPSMQVDAEKVC